MSNFELYSDSYNKWALIKYTDFDRVGRKKSKFIGHT